MACNPMKESVDAQKPIAVKTGSAPKEEEIDHQSEEFLRRALSAEKRACEHAKDVMAARKEADHLRASLLCALRWIEEVLVAYGLNDIALVAHQDGLVLKDPLHEVLPLDVCKHQILEILREAAARRIDFVEAQQVQTTTQNIDERMFAMHQDIIALRLRFKVLERDWCNERRKKTSDV